MMHLSIGYDHRMVDGAVADQFMAEVKKVGKLERGVAVGSRLSAVS